MDKIPSTYFIAVVNSSSGEPDLTTGIVKVIDKTKVPGLCGPDAATPYEAVGKALQAAARDCGAADKSWEDFLAMPDETIAPYLAKYGLALDNSGMYGVVITDGAFSVGESTCF